MTRNIIYFIFFTVLVLSACTKERSYTAAVISIKGRNATLTGRTPSATIATDIPATQYAIVVTFDVLLTGHNNGTDIKGETQYSITNRPINAVVYSLTAFDAAHPAGTLLGDYFTAINDTFANTPKPFSASNLTPDFDFKSKRSDADTFRRSSYIILTGHPAIPGPRYFIILFYLADSTTMSDTLHVNLL